MNTRRRRVIIASGVLLYILIQGVHANPNHLEPIRPYDPMDGNYDQAVFTSLIGKAWTSLWMIEKPSFSREYAVILRYEVDYDPNDVHYDPVQKAERVQWFIEHVVPKEKIWKGIRTGPDGELLAVKPTEDVERHLTPITKDLAQVLQEAWRSVLELTRYAEPRNMLVLDGTTLQFYHGGRFGEVWLPGTGLPGMLAHLGRKLRTVALSDEKNKEPLLAEASDLARQITKEAEAEQVKVFGKKMFRTGGRGGQTLKYKVAPAGLEKQGGFEGQPFG